MVQAAFLTGQHDVIVRRFRIGKVQIGTVPVVQVMEMSPNTQYNDTHQDDTNPHELTHGFPNTLYHRVPSCKCRNLGRKKEHGHESNPRKEYGVMQPVGPKTGVVWIVVEKSKSKTHRTQYHAGNEKRFGLILKYKLRIQVHIARSDWPNFIRVNWFFSVLAYIFNYLPGAAGGGAGAATALRPGPEAVPFAGFSILLKVLAFSLYSRFLAFA